MTAVGSKGSKGGMTESRMPLYQPGTVVRAARSGYYELGGGIVHLNAGPGAVIVAKTGETVTRWCFKDRKHLEHTWLLYDYDVRSYYDPWWVCVCSSCGEDHTEFPS